MESFTSRKISVLMFPWPAYGHNTPFLEVAKALIQRNFSIYICSTLVNLNCIQNMLGKGYADSIKLVELHLPISDKLPPHYHTTKNLPSHLMPTLREALDLSKLDFSSIIKTLNPDIIIYDYLQPWAPIIASEYDIPAIVFITTSAAMTSLKLHYDKYPDLKYPFSNIFRHNFDDDSLRKTEKDGEAKDRFISSIENSNDLIMVKSCREIEKKYIGYLSRLAKKKIALVGPLVKATSTDNDGNDIMEWLDKKALVSTVFVSFGSEYFLTEEEIKEVAYGLELSNVNFIWVIRSPIGEKSRVEAALSKDFFEKIKGKGIIKGWAPQAKVLDHPSIGAFVSHCGWSSVMEGIKYNVPIIAAPMHIDQPVNARVVKKIGVGVEVLKEKNGIFKRDDLAKAIKDVIKGEFGTQMRKKEELLNAKIKMNEEKILDNFAKELVKLVKKNKKNGNWCNGIVMDYF